MTHIDTKKLSEILTHHGEDRADYYNAVSPPIVQTSNFAFEDTASFRKAFLDERGHHLYTRGNNPTTEILRKKIAALEGTEDCLVFGSGTAAMSCAVLSNVETGDHIICVQNPYSWTNKLVMKMLPRFGITHTFVTGKDPDEIESAIQENTVLLILESPNSLTFECQDLQACADICKKHGLISVIDNTYTSPLYQNPAQYGIDLIMHTCSKYLNGHSDVIAGAVCGSQVLMDKIFHSEFMTLGPVLSPHDAHLIIRGLRTLQVRMERITNSTIQVARFLSNHPKVERVIHPLFTTFDQYALASKQMSGAGGLFSILLKAESTREVNQFVDKLDRFLLAVSWGGHESLVLPISIFYDIPDRDNPPYPFNLIRFYVGLESPEYLIEDLENALQYDAEL